jgi:hypothetical protein
MLDARSERIRREFRADDMEAIQITVGTPKRVGALWRMTASLQGLQDGPSQLFYEIDAPRMDHLEPDGAPFLLPLIFAGMAQGRPMVLRGAAVCPMLLEGLHRLQTAWSLEQPERYRAVEIDAPVHSSPPVLSTPDTRISSFSGGLDSCYTLGHWRRRQRPKGADELVASVLVWGFDIPLARPREALIAMGQARRVTGSVGVPLYTVRTNVRFLPIDWLDAHGTALSAVMHLFQGVIGGGLIPASVSFEEMNLIWGSHPAQDPWLSSRHFPIASDGHEAPRNVKSLILSDWPEARSNLRICTHDTGVAGNCGVCRKCVITKCMMLARRVPLEGLMAGEPTFDQVARLPLGHFWCEMDMAREALRQARAEGLDRAPWARGLRRALLLHRFVPGWKRRGPVVRGVGLDPLERPVIGGDYSTLAQLVASAADR